MSSSKYSIALMVCALALLVLVGAYFLCGPGGQGLMHNPFTGLLSGKSVRWW